MWRYLSNCDVYVADSMPATLRHLEDKQTLRSTGICGRLDVCWADPRRQRHALGRLWSDQRRFHGRVHRQRHDCSLPDERRRSTRRIHGQILASTDRYSQVLTGIYKYWQVLTSIDRYLQVFAGIHKFCQVFTSIGRYSKNYCQVVTSIDKWHVTSALAHVCVHLHAFKFHVCLHNRQSVGANVWIVVEGVSSFPRPGIATGSSMTSFSDEVQTDRIIGCRWFG